MIYKEEVLKIYPYAIIKREKHYRNPFFVAVPNTPGDHYYFSVKGEYSSSERNAWKSAYKEYEKSILKILNL